MSELSKLTKAQKRVLVARDVLKLLRVGKIEAQCGIYFRSEHPIDRSSAEELQKQLPKLGACTVCAIGAAFYAQVLRFNRLPANALSYTDADSIGPNAMRHSLHRLFSADQLRDIENAFEDDWLRQYRDDEERLWAIMQNIIANKGTFKPELVPA